MDLLFVEYSTSNAKYQMWNTCLIPNELNCSAIDYSTQIHSTNFYSILPQCKSCRKIMTINSSKYNLLY